MRTLQLALPKTGIAWMFALLTISFNRITIGELAVPALLVGALLAIYPLLAPTQPWLGRAIDRWPLLGRRRAPYLLVAMLGSAAIFPLLPGVAIGLGRGDAGALALGTVLMILFGIGIALIANTYLDLVAQATTEATRAGTFGAAWTAQTAAISLWAWVFGRQMPAFTPETMQALFNLTPLVALATTLPCLFGLEARGRAPAPTAREAAPNAWRVLNSDVSARGFFAFVVLGIIGIFLQDLVLEVLGGRVFGMSVGESTSLQQTWNGAVLLAMLGTTPLVASRPALRLPIATGGAIATSAALLGLAIVAQQALAGLLFPVLIVLGICAGVFTGATVMLMSDMTMPGATGRYLGLWSLAQALGTSAAFLLAGVLHTAFVERAADVRGGYALIFTVEALMMLLSVVALRSARVRNFQARRVAAPAA